MKRYCKGHLLIILIFCILALLCFIPTVAGADQDYTLSVRDFELPDSSEYNLKDSKSVERFFYGDRSMGFCRLIGAIETVTTYNGYNAYGVNGGVSIHYTYGGKYQKNDPHRWYVDDDGMGKVNGYDFGALFTGVGHGCIIVEKSSDAKNWTLVQDPGLPKLNYFADKKAVPDSLIYTIPENEVIGGMYYRVLVAYRFSRKTNDGFMYIGDQHEYKKCIELYQFYVSSENNNVTIHDLGDGTVLQDQESTPTGFMIRKNGSTATVKIKEKEGECRDFDYFAEPGEYTIEVTTNLNKTYSSTITITNGVNFTPVEGTVFTNKKEDGFQLVSKASNTVFGGPLTSLSLVTPREEDITKYKSRHGAVKK